MKLIINGLTLKENRKKFNLTQDELAEIIKVSRKTINNYEKNGNIPESKIKLFEKIFEEMRNNVTKNSVVVSGKNTNTSINSNNFDNKDNTELLKKEIELYKKEIELLQRENELLKKEK